MSKVLILSSGFISGVVLTLAISAKIEEIYEKRLDEIRLIKAYHNKGKVSKFTKIKKEEDLLFTFLSYTYYDSMITNIINALKFINKDRKP
jgi:hypothetical protein